MKLALLQSTVDLAASLIKSRTAPPKTPAAVAASPADVQTARLHAGMARRDTVFQAVRDALLDAGLQPTAYQCQVMWLDQIGSTFMVVLDVAPQVCDISTLSRVESFVVDVCQDHHSIVVKALYWRVNDGLQAPAPATPPAPGELPMDDELEAFRRAVATGASAHLPAP